MTNILNSYSTLTDQLERANWLLPSLARFLFAAILLVYFLNSGMTKLGDGFTGIYVPSVGAYAQIFPKVFEAAGYDTAGMTFYHQLIVVGATWAEFILPALIVLGLLTRMASLGMIGFIVVQSLTDIYGHGLAPELGAWFDRFPSAMIVDQRALWIFLLIILVLKGAGPFSFDRALRSRRRQPLK